MASHEDIEKVKRIDPQKVRDLAEEYWDNHMIAAFFGCNESTIRRRFAAEVHEGRQSGKANLISELRMRARNSDAILKHLADRVLGPVEQKYTIDVAKLPLEQKKEVLRTLIVELDENNGQPAAIGPGESEIVSSENIDDTEVQS